MTVFYSNQDLEASNRQNSEKQREFYNVAIKIA